MTPRSAPRAKASQGLDEDRGARTLWRDRLIALAMGAATPLGFAPFHLALLPILSLAVLFALWLQTSPRRAFVLGWMFGLGTFGVGASWIHVSISQFGGVSAPLAATLTAGFVAAMAIYPAVAGYVAARFLRSSLPGSLIAGFPAAWTLVEWIRGWFLSGFSWLDLGYSQTDSGLEGLAPLFGVYGVSWAVALSSGLLVLAIRTKGRMRLAAGAGLAALWLMALGVGRLDWTWPSREPLRVVLLQGNIEQRLKWSPEERQRTLDLYARLTRSHWGADLIVWPETAAPLFLDQAWDGYLAELAREARAHGTDLLIGIPVREPEGTRYYNGMLSLGRSPGVYRKRHLVPFGEYLPMKSLLAGPLAFLDIPMSDFSAGDRTERSGLVEAAGLPIGASICYEDVFGAEMIAALPEASLLVNISNDGWFGDSLAPHQHLQIARVRALEAGRYLLRATNTGISAAIAPDGSVIARSPQFVTDALLAEVVPRAGATPFARWGNLPVVLGALGSILLIGVRAARAGRRLGRSPAKDPNRRTAPCAIRSP